MSRLFYHVMQDNAGNLLFGVTGTMRLAGTGTLATIYGDEGLTVILPNPMTNHPSFGSFKCYLGASASGYDFYLSKSGYTFETLTGVQGLGTMAQQDAGAVAITGGSAVGLSGLAVGTASLGGQLMNVDGGMTYFGQPVGIQRAPSATIGLSVNYDRGSKHGAMFVPNADTGPGNAIIFANAAVTSVGAINTTSTTTNYNISSDARLKHAITPLTGALDVVQALRPVAFRWNVDDSPGVGFIASEVAAHVQGVITGEADAVHEDGSILPQMIDYSKLVPFLTGAVQTLAAQVASLSARLVVLEDALGV